MGPSSLETVCPVCGQALTLTDDLPPPTFHCDVQPIVEAECPDCGCEFAVDLDGRVVDDGGADPEPPFELNDEGELDAEGLRRVYCPHCQQPHETGEPGLTGCRHCRQAFVVEDGHWRQDGQRRYFQCEECDLLLVDPPGDGPGLCPDCGCPFVDLHEEWKDEAGLPLTCPRCGCDSDNGVIEEDDGDREFFFPLRWDGRAVCWECGHAFLPVKEGGLPDPQRLLFPEEDEPFRVGGCEGPCSTGARAATLWRGTGNSQGRESCCTR
jgi:hypothetical protein